MRIKALFFLVVSLLVTSCSEDDTVEQEPDILSEVIAFHSDLELDEVIACAASEEGNNSISSIYYYPIPGARNIQYFETNSIDLDPNNFENYHKVQLPSEDVFGGYLERYIRSGINEVYSIVTFETSGRFHRSNPIRLKNATKPTEYTNSVTIDTSQELMPLFTWNDGVFPENAIYFQVISDRNDEFLSGTYTFDKWFQFYNLSNVVLDINREVPQDLIKDEQYHFNMLGVSIDNWVNIFISNINFTAQ